MTAHPYPSLLRTAEALKTDCLVLTDELEAPRRYGRMAGLAAIGGLAALLIAGALWLLLGSSSPRPGAETAHAPAMPQDLIAATRGPQAAILVTGQRAEAINASIPFHPNAIQAANAFNLGDASMTAQERALRCLTQAVYYEAGFEPVDGRRAVAQVVLNRVRHPAFPHTVCGVVYDGSTRPGCQFSFTCDGSLRRAPSPAAWSAAQQIAREALAGHVEAEVGNATHYHASYVAPYWAPRLTKLRQIGAHIFYTWPGAWGRSSAFSARYAGVEGVFTPSFGAAPTEVAAAPLPPPDPTDRRAPEDVGGRLDVTKGWTLSIPSPEETRGSYAAMMNRQAGQSAAPAATPASTSAAQ
jgi:spore germination cell wall hydrolase CwlJ-like protein